MRLLTTAFPLFLARCAWADEDQAGKEATEAPAITVSTTTADPYYKDLKSTAFLQAFFNGAGDKKLPRNLGYNDWCKFLMADKHNDLLKKKTDLMLNNHQGIEYLPGGKEFFREQFDKYDADLDGYLDEYELAARQRDVDNLVNDALENESDFPAFENTLAKSIERNRRLSAEEDASDSEEDAGTTDLTIDYDEFVYYSTMTNIVHGFGLKKKHNIYALVKRGPGSIENSYVCIAEFGWMMRIWISLTGQYNGPYEKAERNDDFRSKYAVKNDKGKKAKYEVGVLAAWYARILNDLLAGRPIYGALDEY